MPLTFAAAGLLLATSGTNAAGIDLRPGRYTDLADVVAAARARNQALTAQVSALQADVDQVRASVDQVAVDAAHRRVNRLEAAAGLTPVRGPAVQVSLDDAPASVEVPPGVDPNDLVVHQQDIQAVVNALWAGGAEAMSLQGQRIISTTGVKCVGNTVVLHGVPYAPPYRVVAVGDPARLTRALARSDYIDTYLDYVAAYELGWSVRRLGPSRLPPYEGVLDLVYAEGDRHG